MDLLKNVDLRDRTSKTDNKNNNATSYEEVNSLNLIGNFRDQTILIEKTLTTPNTLKRDDNTRLTFIDEA